MPRISEINFDDRLTQRFPANEFVEIALSKDEYAAFKAKQIEVRMSLLQGNGRLSYDFAIPIKSFSLDKTSGEWIAVETGTDHFIRSGSIKPKQRWTISSTKALRNTPQKDSFSVIETVGVYTKSTSDKSIIDSQLMSPVADNTERLPPQWGALVGRPVNSVHINTTKFPSSLQFNQPKPNTQILAQPTPGDSGIVCFTQGVLVQTNKGLVAIENLVPGDEILTMDMGFQKLRWIGSKHLSANTLKTAPHLRPIRIKANAIGHGIPDRDLMVSPQHRILVNGKIPLRMSGKNEVLIAAKHLLDLNGIEVAEELSEVTYIHILFDRHQIVWANGAASESLYTGPEAIKTLTNAQLNEIYAIFPNLCKTPPCPDGSGFVREPIPGRIGRNMAKRIRKNRQPAFTKCFA